MKMNDFRDYEVRTIPSMITVSLDYLEVLIRSNERMVALVDTLNNKLLNFESEYLDEPSYTDSKLREILGIAKPINDKKEVDLKMAEMVGLRDFEKNIIANTESVINETKGVDADGN